MEDFGSSAGRPVGVTAIALFFVFGTVMSGLTAVMLLFPGSALDALWRFNPQAKVEFGAMGGWAVALMLVVSAACATAAAGLWRVRGWGWWTAVAILAVNLAGDTANAFLLHDWRTLIGLPIGGTMLAYLASGRRKFQR